MWLGLDADTDALLFDRKMLSLWEVWLSMWCGVGVSMEENSSNEVRSNSDMVVLLAIHPSSVDTATSRWPMKG